MSSNRNPHPELPFVDVPALIAAIRDLEILGDAAHITRMTTQA